MKRYIRMKNGRIYDTTNYEQGIEQLQKLHPTEELDSFLNKEDIIAESDNVIDLIQVGDLVRKIEHGIDDFYYMRNDLERNIIVNRYRIGTQEYRITKIYTQQGDKYILIWDSKRGVI